MEIIEYKSGTYRSLRTKELDGYTDILQEQYCYVVTCSYYIKFKYLNKIYELVVPTRFLSDGASFSRDVGQSWMFHDYLYAVHHFQDASVCTREMADQLMTSIAKYEDYKWFSWSFDWVSWLNLAGIFAKAYHDSGARGAQFLPDNLELY